MRRPLLGRFYKVPVGPPPPSKRPHAGSRSSRMPYRSADVEALGPRYLRDGDRFSGCRMLAEIFVCRVTSQLVSGPYLSISQQVFTDPILAYGLGDFKLARRSKRLCSQAVRRILKEVSYIPPLKASLSHVVLTISIP